MRKGQTAMEYLMTYGWAILIVLIVGAIVILVVYPAISKPPSSKSGFGNIDVASPWDFNAAGQIRFQIDNRLGNEINITTVNFGPGTTTCSQGLLQKVSTGSRSNIIICTNAAEGGAKTGDTYSINVSILYDVTGGLTGITSTGTLVGTRS